jgi:tetratricopeptide (TPR) repeat protein
VIISYTRGLACLPEDAGESKRDLHRNRSLANLHLGRYDATISDALLSVSDDRDEVARKKDAKALYRTGRANYQLGNLVGALALFEKMLELCPADEKGTAELNKTKTRLLEQETGNYDFAEIINELSKNKFLADRASFVGRTEVGQTSDRGRGLFATQNLAMGDLILCEKAFMVAHTSEPEPAAADHLTQLCILNKLMDNPSLSKGILDLYSGETPKTTAMLIIDGQAVIDVFEIAQIFKYNAFAYAVGNEQQMYGTSGMRAPDAGVSTGIWLRASYANHACNFNSTRSFFGDLIVYRATRDIARGAEITIAYISPTADDEMSKIMLPNWGFNCSCILCNHEAATNVDRSGLLEASNAFLDVHWIGANINFDYEVLEQAVTLAVDFLESYSSNLSLQLPCLGACPIYLWLCQVYFTLGDAENTLATAEEVLRLHGYRLVVEDSTVSLDATHGFLTPGVVDTLMHVFKSLKNLKPALGREFKVLAKRFYLTLNGSLAGFGARYD